MNHSNSNTWMHRFLCGLALATLALVALGGMVTTKGVGMAVPDWPTTYGDHMFLFPPSKWMAGIFYEHSHRLWASLVGLLAAIFAIWAWVRDTRGRERWVGVALMLVAVGAMGVRTPAVFVGMAVVCLGVIAFGIRRALAPDHRLRWLAVILLAAVIIQGVLGGLRVLLDEHGWGKEFGIFHAMLAQVFFVLVCSTVLLTSKWWARANDREISPATGSRLQWFLLLTTVLVFVQIFFGATMRHQHQGLAVPDFPLAYGKVWPDTDPASVAGYNSRRIEVGGESPITAFHITVHMLHRYTGFIALFAIVGCAVAAWRRTSPGSALRKAAGLWVGIAVVQVLLGILSILFQRKLDVTTSHVAVGALTLMIGWVAFLMVRRVTATNSVLATSAESRLAARALKHA